MQIVLYCISNLLIIRNVMNFRPEFILTGTGLIVDLTLIRKETDVMIYDILGRLICNRNYRVKCKHVI